MGGASELVCPKCSSKAVGKIGQNQYYCWDCNVEYVPYKDGYRIYRIEADGTAVLESPANTASLPPTGKKVARAR